MAMLILHVTSQCDAFEAIRVGIKPEKSVADLKRRIAEETAMEEDSLLLYYRGDVMEDTRTLESYDMSSYPNVQVALRMVGQPLIVVTPGNKTLTILADLEWTTETLISAIITKEPSLQSSSLELMVDDVVLEGKKTLRSQEVTTEKTVQTRVLLKGGI